MKHKIFALEYNATKILVIGGFRHKSSYRINLFVLSYCLLDGFSALIQCCPDDTNSGLPRFVSAQFIVQQLTTNSIKHKVYQSNYLVCMRRF